MANKPTDTDTKTNQNEGNSSWKDYVIYFLGIGVLLIFFLFVMFMLTLLGVQETEWNRAVFVFTAVEAIAFAATGFFFGKEVNRQQVDSAQRDADAARVEAQDAAKRAAEAETKGKALAAAIEVKATGRGGRGQESTGAKSGEIEEINALARKLFG